MQRLWHSAAESSLSERDADSPSTPHRRVLGVKTTAGVRGQRFRTGNV